MSRDIFTKDGKSTVVSDNAPSPALVHIHLMQLYYTTTISCHQVQNPATNCQKMPFSANPAKLLTLVFVCDIIFIFFKIQYVNFSAFLFLVKFYFPACGIKTSAFLFYPGWSLSNLLFSFIFRFHFNLPRSHRKFFSNMLGIA